MGPNKIIHVLGYSGLIPFYLFSIMTALEGYNFFIDIFFLYSAIILCFLSGSLWMKLIAFFYMTSGFVLESIMRDERGMDTAWMPVMWPIKSCLWFGILFLIIQGISETLKSFWAATKDKWPDEA